MAGIQVFSNIGGKYLEAPEFRSFLEKANATKTPIWIHPQLREEWSHEFILDKILGWPYDTTVAMCRLVFSGAMEELPDLKIITHHMGGMVPFYSERIEGFYEARSMYPKAGVKQLSENPLNYFKRFFNDTVLNGALHSFECGYKFFGAAQTVFATDYPFGPGSGETWMAGALDQMCKIEIAAKEKEMIYSGNLLNLIKRS
jgi:aminocarboxymuconate-semialdehyde decarboxylase